MLNHALQPDCPSGETGILFLEDTPESLTDAYCYDPAVTSDVDCGESVTPPAKESSAVTSEPGLDGDDGIETEVKYLTSGPEDGYSNSTTGDSEMAVDRDENPEVAVDPSAGTPMSTEAEGEEGAETKPFEDFDEVFGGNATTLSANDTTAVGDLEDTLAEDVHQVNGTTAVAEDTGDEHMNGTETVLEDMEGGGHVNGTEEIPDNTSAEESLQPSEASPSEREETEEEEEEEESPVGLSTPATVTASESDDDDDEDAGKEENADSQDDNTTASSPDSVAETTESPGDKDAELEKEPSNYAEERHDSPAPRGRMGRKNNHTHQTREESGGAPGWLIIFAFVMVVTALVCIFAAIATKDRWLGPGHCLSKKTADSSENGEKRAAVSLTAEKEHEMTTLMNKGQAQTNGRMDEFTVIALEETPEKECLA
ncbi:uncharacterized protein cd44a isoform X2 [Engraulis encrasicolus]